MITSLGRPLWRAAVTAASLFAVAVTVALLAAGGRAVDVGGLALLLAGTLPLAVRARWPVAAVSVVTAASILYHALDYPDEATLPALLAGLYSLTISRPPRYAYLAGGLLATLVLVVAIVNQDGGMVDTVGWLAAAIGLGRAVHSGRAEADEAKLRAESAERAHEAETSRRVVEQRLVLAREVHDILAHGITAISVQAGVAAHLLRQDRDADQEKLARALDAVTASCHRASTDVRSLLDVLRDLDDPDSTGPLPTVAELPDLVRRSTTASVHMYLAVTGEPRPMAPTVEVTAYRLVQEALTNVLKHARASRADIRLAYHEDALRISVTDDGNRTPNGNTGHGLAGMHERVRIVGGQLTAGPRSSGGFAVSARLPLPPRERKWAR